MLPSQAGTSRFGPYELLGALGAGGMGEVLRARDTRLGREVALKILRADLLGDADRRARFEREARTLAALNHPHIAAIYDVLDAGDHRAIVMELVAGRTLSQVLAEGPLPLRVALDYGVAIADALGAAHAAGIVHRDLKPANVMVDPRGQVKVLDFGIAKLAELDSHTGELSTFASLTGEHALVGTIGYMSPEQAERRPLDGRSDVFSLGVLLYEMLTGRRAFDAPSAAGVLTALLRDEPPPLREVLPTVPVSVERIVRRSLQKDPAQRFQAVLDVRHALDDARDDLSRAPAPPVPPGGADAPARPRTGAWLPRVAFLAAGVALGAFATALAPPTETSDSAVAHYRPFVTEADSAKWPAWSPDGKTLAYVATVGGSAQLFVRGLAAAQPVQLTNGTQDVDARPFWAPDGTTVYFGRGADLYVVGLAGGEPRLVGRDVRGGLAYVGGAISRDGRTVVFSRGQLGEVSLWTLDTQTGTTTRLEREGMPAPLRQVVALAFSPGGTTLGMLASTTGGGGVKGVWLLPWPTGAARHVLPDAPYHATDQSFGWLPDDRRIVFNASPPGEATSRLFIGDTRSSRFRQLTDGVGDESDLSVAPKGDRVAFVSTRTGIDLTQLPVDGGPPLALLQSSRTESYPDMSASGVLAYVTDADGRPGVRLRAGSDLWSRRVGSGDEPAEAVADQIQGVRLSPDGQRVAAGVVAAEHAIWVYPAGGGVPVRLDTASTDQHGASWSPDGNWLAYRRLSGGKWELVKAPLGGGHAVRLADADPGGLGPGGATDWATTNEWIAYQHGERLCLIAPDGGATKAIDGPRPVSFRFSRDGARLFVVRRGDARRWELAIYDVTTGNVLRRVVLPLVSNAIVEGLALTPDESHVIVGTGTPTSDIWLIDPFEPPTLSWSTWFSWN